MTLTKENIAHITKETQFLINDINGEAKSQYSVINLLNFLIDNDQKKLAGELVSCFYENTEKFDEEEREQIEALITARYF